VCYVALQILDGNPHCTTFKCVLEFESDRHLSQVTYRRPQNFFDGQKYWCKVYTLLFQGGGRPLQLGALQGQLGGIKTITRFT
jgi:hypothetical protein